MAKKKIKKGKVIISATPKDVLLMVDFTAMQLKLCYDKLNLYPEIQAEIEKLIKKLAKL